MPAGRPSEYKPEYCQKVDEYLASQQDEEFEFHKTVGDKSDSYERAIKVKLPTINGFALFINVPRSTIFDWKKEFEEFSDSLDKIVHEQEQRLLNNGLGGMYNPTIAKLILSSNHGYKEREDVTTNDKDMPTPIYGGKSKL